MASTLRFPLSFSALGKANELPEESRLYYDQAIAVAVRTQPGEFPLDFDYGTIDPAFTDGEPSGLRQTLTRYWPEILVSRIQMSRAQQDGSAQINVEYSV